jgi:hypothetical protein
MGGSLLLIMDISDQIALAVKHVVFKRELSVSGIDEFELVREAVLQYFLQMLNPILHISVNI